MDLEASDSLLPTSLAHFYSQQKYTSSDELLRETTTSQTLILVP